MNQNNRSARRRWGVFAGLGAAAGAAVAAALIPAAPAFADPVDAAVVGGGAVGKQLDALIIADTGGGPNFNPDVDAIYAGVNIYSDGNPEGELLTETFLVNHPGDVLALVDTDNLFSSLPGALGQDGLAGMDASLITTDVDLADLLPQMPAVF
jgi:hypothetical protein